MDDENNFYNHSEMLNRVNSWIHNCDAKISFALAFSGVLLGVFFTNNRIQDSLIVVIKNVVNLEKKELISLVATVILIGFMIFLTLSIWYFFRGLKGSIDKSNYKQKELKENSLLFFGTIEAMEYAEYRQEVESLTKDKLKNDYLSQIYINSIISNNKFVNYNKGVVFLIISVILFVLLNLIFWFM